MILNRPKSEQVVSVTINASPFNVNIVICVSTSEADDQTVDYFYQELGEVYSSFRPNKVSIVVGD